MNTSKTLKKPLRSLFITSILGISLLTVSTITADQQPATNEDHSILAQEGSISVTKQEAMKILGDMNKVQQVKILREKEQLQRLLLDQLIIKKKVKKAIEQKLNDDPIIQWKIQKSTNIILANALTTNYKKQIKLPTEIQLLAKEYYDTHPEEFLVKERVKVAHILIKSSKSESQEVQKEKKELAKKILGELKQGSDFSEAAKEFSDDKGSARLGGVIEYFTRGRMVKPFEDAAFNLTNKDDLSELIETRFGYHIIKLLDRKKEFTKEYDVVKNKLLNKEREKYRDNRVKSFNKSFHTQKDSTTIYMPAIEALLKEAKEKYLPM